MPNPNPAWLSYVKTEVGTCSKIRHYLKTMQHEQAAALGERLLDQELRALSVDPAVSPPPPGTACCATAATRP